MSLSPVPRPFRLLARLFPSEFRAEFGAEMAETFAAERREAERGGRGSVPRLWLRTLGGALRTAPREHWDLLRRDGAVALRALRRRPGFAATVIATLGLGLGANAAVFAIVEAVVLRPLAFPHPERLVTLWERDAEGKGSNTTYATYLDVAARSRTLQSLTVFGDAFTSVSGGGGAAELLRGLRVTPSFFATLGIEPALGRGFVPAENRRGEEPVAVLSHELWQRRFGGDRGILDRPIQLAGRPTRVVGILPPAVPGGLARALYGESLDYVVPLRYEPGYAPACRTCRHLKAVARLRPGVAVATASGEVDGILRALAAEHPRDYPAAGAIVRSLHDDFVGESRRPLLALWGAVGCVLLIAAVNVAGLLLARGAERGHELSLRAALGASRGRLFRQLVTESAVLALLGSALAIGLAAALLRVLAAMPGLGVNRLEEARLGLPLALAVVAIAALLALVMTVAPALRVLRSDLRGSMRHGARTVGGQRGRGALVVAQVALALVLLVSAGLLLASLRRLLSQDPGFEPGGVLTAELTLLTPRYDERQPSADYLDALLGRLRAIPGVESAGALHMVPVSGEIDSYGFHVEEQVLPNEALAPEVILYRASPGTDRTLRLRRRAGRFFDGRDRDGSLPVAVLGESAARRLGWPRTSPLGKRVQFGARQDEWRTVVGVVGDLRHSGLGAPPPLQAYIPFAQDFPFRLVVMLRGAGDPETLVPALRRAAAELDPEVPVRRVRSMDEAVGDTLARRRFGLWLIGAFAALAVLLAAVGLYGMLAYTVAQRGRELGVRQALGAASADVVGLVLRQGLRRVLLGLALGWPAAVLAARLLRSLLFEVRPSDPLVSAIVAAVLLAACLLASWIPARRAAAIDPAVVLRGE